MRKLALALAATAALGFTAPLFTATDASAAEGMRVSQSDISSAHRRGHVKKVIVRRDRGHHHRHGWSRHHGGKKVVVIKKRTYR